MKIEEIITKMEAIVSLAETETRSLTDEEITTYEGLEKDLAASKKTEELRSRQAAYNTPVISNVHQATNLQDKDYERAYDEYLRTGNRSIPELRAQTEGTNSQGGYMVPTVLQDKIIDRIKAFGGLINVANVVNTAAGNPLTYPTLDDTANVAVVTAENAAFGTGVGADLVFGQVSLNAYKYTTLGTGDAPLIVSVELLQDSAFDIGSLIAKKFGQRIGRKEATDFATGTGSSQPKGILTTTKDVILAGTGANTITYERLLTALHKVDPGYRQNAHWVFNDAALGSIQGIVDSQNRPLWLGQAQSGMETLPGGTLLGYPVQVDNSFPAVASGTNFAVFGDIEEAYTIRQVQGVTIVADPYTNSKNGEVLYVGWARADGQIINRNAYVTIAGG